MRILGLIPARSGSKGIKGKNLVRLAGKPLLFYTCKAALRSRKLNRIVLSTNDSKIAKVGRKCGVDVPFIRPKKFALDQTPMIQVVKHALDALRKWGDKPYDAVVILQPTSPLRKTQHIDETIRRFQSMKADTAVTVVQIPHSMSPDSAMVMKKGQLKPWKKGPLVLSRQKKNEFVARNGPAVLVVRTKVIRSGQLYGKKLIGVPMSMLESIDIDHPQDLWLAEALLQNSISRRR